MNFNQLQELVVKPTLRYLSPEIPYSEEAVDLLMMTACHESNCGEYLKQINGPALGIYQMEPDTHDDIYGNYIGYRDELQALVINLPNTVVDKESAILTDDLIHNLVYATAMARVHYYRVPSPLPVKSGQTELSYYRALAKYAKQHYNTRLGAAKEEDYYNAYKRHSE